MRTAVVATAVLLLLSGCLGSDEDPLDDEGEDGSMNSTSPGEEPLPPLPEDVERSIDITAGFDIPLPEGEEEFCWMPTSACAWEPFSIPDGAPAIQMQAELSWGLDANNLGLFLYERDQEIAYDSSPDPEVTSRSLSHTFESGGDYSIAVDPHWSGPDTAELTITFTWA